MALLRRHASRFLALLAAIWMLGNGEGACAALPPPIGLSGVATQQSIHAAFIVNITRFIQWPDTAFGFAEAPLVIGTFEHDPINADLDAAVQGEKIGSHRLETRRIHALEDLAHCQVVYVASADPRRSTVLARVVGKPILTISDGTWLLHFGGHICFVSAPMRTRLRINNENLRGSQLQARAQLLRVAEMEEP